MPGALRAAFEVAWTYLVHENPFGTDIDRVLQSIARRIRKLVVLSRTGRRAAPTGETCTAACPRVSYRYIETIYLSDMSRLH